MRNNFKELCDGKLPQAISHQTLTDLASEMPHLNGRQIKSLVSFARLVSQVDTNVGWVEAIRSIHKPNQKGQPVRKNPDSISPAHETESGPFNNIPYPTSMEMEENVDLVLLGTSTEREVQDARESPVSRRPSMAAGLHVEGRDRHARYTLAARSDGLGGSSDGGREVN